MKLKMLLYKTFILLYFVKTIFRLLIGMYSSHFVSQIFEINKQSNFRFPTQPNRVITLSGGQGLHKSSDATRPKMRSGLCPAPTGIAE